MYICPNPKCQKRTFKKLETEFENIFTYRCSTCGYETEEIIKNDEIILSAKIVKKY